MNLGGAPGRGGGGGGGGLASGLRVYRGHGLRGCSLVQLVWS